MYNKSIPTVFFACLFFCVSYVQAQVTVYKTYKDFEAGEGEKYDDYHGYFHSGGKLTIRFYNEGSEPVKFSPEEMWGFKYKDALFRTDFSTNHPTRVVATGKICYYENGIAHLTMIKKNTNIAEISIGHPTYVSEGLNTEMTHGGKSLKALLSKPEYTSLDKCIRVFYDPTTVRNCVVEFLNP